MEENAFNYSQFYFKVHNASAVILNVGQVNCVNDGVSSNYRFHIHCDSETYYTPSKLIRLTAVLYWNDEVLSLNNYRHGIIVVVRHIGTKAGKHNYHITLCSLLYPLTLRYTLRSYVQIYLQQLFAAILEAAGFLTSQFAIKGQTNPQLLYRVQYQESDYAFFQSLLLEYGYQYIWLQDEVSATLTITDNLHRIAEKIPIIAPLQNSSITQTYTQGNLSYTEVLTNNRLLQSGQLVELQGHCYRLVNICHHIEQDPQNLSQQSRLRYQANLRLMDKSIMLYADPRDTPDTIVTNAPLFTCATETTGGIYPFLDELGCYRTRLPFDDALPPTQASPAEGLLQPHDTGQHFPIVAGVELLVSHWSGDVSQPVLIGALNNAVTASPVNNANNSQHIVQTEGGNQILLDDWQAQPRIQLSNPQQLNQVLLDATPQKAQLSISSRDTINFIAQNTSVFTQGSHYQSTLSFQTEVQGQQTVYSNEQIIQAGGNFAISSRYQQIQAQALQMLSSKQAIISSENLQITNQDQFQLKSTAADVQIVIGTNVNFQSGAILNIQALVNSIKMDANGITITTPLLNVNATTITCPQPPSAA